MKSNFILNRLLAMSPLEIAYRIKQTGQILLEKILYRSYYFDDSVKGLPNPLFGKIEIAGKLRDQLVAQAEAICQNRLNLLALYNFHFGDHIDYHLDYKSGISLSKQSFGKTIDFREPEKVGDIKYVWEVNRLLFLLPLALAYRVTGQNKYLDKFKNLLDEWLIQNQFMQGINWVSSLELAIRLINWTFCWHLVADDLNELFKEKWLQSIYRHCWFIRRNLSLYSSANNHLVGELTGLFIATIALPEFKDSPRWRKFAYQRLIQECFRQNYQDGVNKEQSVYYQHYTTEYLLLAGFIGEAYGQDFPEEFWQMLCKNLYFFAALIDAQGNLPVFGDDDGGIIVDLGQRQHGIFQSLLNTAELIFDIPGGFTSNKRELDLKTCFYSHFIKHKKYEGVQNLVFCFPEGGYYLLGKDFGEATEQKCIFDCGPLGFLSLAAHGHADALSFCLAVEGKPIFVDPGTYLYAAEKKWRDYFRSTFAHNTVTIDDLNQSVITGNFIWGHKANAFLLEFEEGRKVKGWHDGYLCLEDGVKHIREINYAADLNRWIIVDTLDCVQKHSIKINFHLHPDCKVITTDKEILIINANVGCRMIIPEQLKANVYYGSNEPLAGWYSPSYDILHKTNTIILYGEINGPSELVTTLYITQNMEGCL